MTEERKFRSKRGSCLFKTEEDCEKWDSYLYDALYEIPHFTRQACGVITGIDNPEYYLSVYKVRDADDLNVVNEALAIMARFGNGVKAFSDDCIGSYIVLVSWMYFVCSTWTLDEYLNFSRNEFLRTCEML